MALFVVFTETWKIYLGEKMKVSRKHFDAIIFYNVRCGLFLQQCLLAVEYHQKQLYEFRDGRPNSVVVPDNVDALR